MALIDVGMYKEAGIDAELAQSSKLMALIDVGTYYFDLCHLDCTAHPHIPVGVVSLFFHHFGKPWIPSCCYHNMPWGEGGAELRYGLQYDADAFT